MACFKIKNFPMLKAKYKEKDNTTTIYNDFIDLMFTFNFEQDLNNKNT